LRTFTGSASVTRAKTERLEKEAAYNQIRALQNDHAALDIFPAILSNAFVQQQKAELADLQRQQAQFSEKLGVNHPDMVKIGRAIRTAEARIQGETEKIVRAMQSDYQRSLAQEHSLTAALEQQKREALDLNRKGIEYGVLARDATSNRQIFESLMQRTKETGIAGELRTSNIRVVDAAGVVLVERVAHRLVGPALVVDDQVEHDDGERCEHDDADLRPTGFRDVSRRRQFRRLGSRNL
jgi:uncharacterized protein involved in exopolysaccharide biosynthesis